MPSAQWVAIDTSWPSHRKTIKLRNLVGSAEWVVYLWCWAADNAPDGILTDMTDSEIEDAIRWKGKEGGLVSALIEVGFIDRSDTETVIHQWMEHAGDHLQRMIINKEKSRIKKEKQRKAELVSLGMSPGTSPGTDTGQEEGRPGSPLILTLPLNLTLSDNSVSPSETDLNGRLAESIKEVFAHYRTHHPRACRNPSPSSIEWRKIKARLGEGSTVEDLKMAIDGYHKHDWHVEKDQLGLELIMRNASHVSDGIVFAEKSKHQLAANQNCKTRDIRHGYVRAEDCTKPTKGGIVEDF